MSSSSCPHHQQVRGARCTSGGISTEASRVIGPTHAVSNHETSGWGLFDQTRCFVSFVILRFAACFIPAGRCERSTAVSVVEVTAHEVSRYLPIYPLEKVAELLLVTSWFRSIFVRWCEVRCAGNREKPALGHQRGPSQQTTVRDLLAPRPPPLLQYCKLIIIL